MLALLNFHFLPKLPITWHPMSVLSAGHFVWLIQSYLKMIICANTIVFGSVGCRSLKKGLRRNWMIFQLLQRRWSIRRCTLCKQLCSWVFNPAHVSILFPPLGFSLAKGFWTQIHPYLWAISVSSPYGTLAASGGCFFFSCLVKIVSEPAVYLNQLLPKFNCWSTIYLSYHAQKVTSIH